HLAVGRALAPLSDEGVLVIGSGHMTHNLRDRRPDGSPPLPYAVEFQAWVDAAIQAHDFDALVDYRRRSPHGARAHPTDEHFLPLFIALGAAAPGYRAERIHDGIESGELELVAPAVRLEHLPAHDRQVDDAAERHAVRLHRIDDPDLRLAVGTVG